MSAQSESEMRRVNELVLRVSDQSGDPEAAHSAEDDAWVATLALIADGAIQPADLARRALETQRVEFPRWYA